MQRKGSLGGEIKAVHAKHAVAAPPAWEAVSPSNTASPARPMAERVGTKARPTGGSSGGSGEGGRRLTSGAAGAADAAGLEAEPAELRGVSLLRLTGWAGSQRCRGAGVDAEGSTVAHLCCAVLSP